MAPSDTALRNRRHRDRLGTYELTDGSTKKANRPSRAVERFFFVSGLKKTKPVNAARHRATKQPKQVNE